MVDLEKAKKLVNDEGFSPSICKEYEKQFIFEFHPKGDKEDPFYKVLNIAVNKLSGAVTYPEFIDIALMEEKPINVTKF